MFIEKIGHSGGWLSGTHRTYKNGKRKVVPVPHETKIYPGDRVYGMLANKWDEETGQYYKTYKRSYTILTIQPQGI